MADVHSRHTHKPTSTATPIKHLVVIYQENVSFDHYFGTYPHAANASGEPPFYAEPDTPKVNGFTKELLNNNPNANNAANGKGAINPFRLSRAQAATADQDHDYMPEQQAFNNGAMDLFPKYTGSGETLPGGTPEQNSTGQVMGYYDGNTVTALWHYAQHFAMSDNSYGTTFGPSTPGAINLVSGQTNGVSDQLAAAGDVVADGQGGYTLISDADPIDDVCSPSSGSRVRLSGKNVGDLLSAKSITWGFFEGGFDLTAVNANGTTGCKRSTTSTVTQVTKVDYIPHHQPFQYYANTANPTHARPTSVAMIGHNGDAAHHQYDINDFYAAVEAGNMPAVSFLKAPGYQDGHAGYSDPLDEQQFVVHVLNFLQKRPEWRDTAVVIAYDDSDGWYDHQTAPQVNASHSSQDALNALGVCNGRSTLPGVNTTEPVQGRCGYGPRLPLLVISPWARRNYVDHTITDQTSITRFIEDNWLGGRRMGGGSFDAMAGKLDAMFDFSHSSLESRRLLLDETTGEPVGASR
ncbi:phospholipase C [Dyella nitratireducens]|uniref:Phospholipase C n=1 Tax=Dyella nitratireducens TaxID=1849580 RepID=A0ABQ1G1P4_9GAMM|nr:alkaline phosphatase family protein [Dyella nitratireducens]GGA35712.1 phospholipase C [Dyella nitratireducens]GLQ41036.1 phospholipase C [Dyella nitratireducens]